MCLVFTNRKSICLKVGEACFPRVESFAFRWRFEIICSTDILWRRRRSFVNRRFFNSSFSWGDFSLFSLGNFEFFFSENRQNVFISIQNFLEAFNFQMKICQLNCLASTLNRIILATLHVKLAVLKPNQTIFHEVKHSMLFKTVCIEQSRDKSFHCFIRHDFKLSSDNIIKHLATNKEELVSYVTRQAFSIKYSGERKIKIFLSLSVVAKALVNNKQKFIVSGALRAFRKEIN